MSLLDDGDLAMIEVEILEGRGDRGVAQILMAHIKAVEAEVDDAKGDVAAAERLHEEELEEKDEEINGHLSKIRELEEAAKELRESLADAEKRAAEAATARNEAEISNQSLRVDRNNTRVNFFAAFERALDEVIG